MYKFTVVAIFTILVNNVLSQPPELHKMNQSSSYGEIGNPSTVLSVNRKDKTMAEPWKFGEHVSSQTEYKPRADVYLTAVPPNAQYMPTRTPWRRNLAVQRYEAYPISSNSFSDVGRSLTNGFENLGSYINNLVNQQRESVRQTSRQITNALDQLGARLVGLA